MPSSNPFKALPKDTLDLIKEMSRVTAQERLRELERDPRRRGTTEHHTAWLRAQQEEAEELGLF